ncbi:unnamed protein product [Brassica oleracea]|uniref:Uncharacterized protein n=2 Tax=Brassica oleracea TaxID=3712 RepID=A0A0D3AHR7_BRAOL|nr:unnamed protein product [Brassica oleracea]
MDESIREMHGRDFGDRVISVNRAELKLGRDDGKVTALRVGGRDSGYSFAGKGSLGGRVDRYTDRDDMWTVNTGLTAEKPTSPVIDTPVTGSDMYSGGRAGVHIRGGDEGRGFRSRAGGPYERPSKSVGGGGHMSSATFDR